MKNAIILILMMIIHAHSGAAQHKPVKYIDRSFDNVSLWVCETNHTIDQDDDECYECTQGISDNQAYDLFGQPDNELCESI